MSEEGKRPHDNGLVTILKGLDFILGMMGSTWEHFKQRDDRSELYF